MIFWILPIPPPPRAWVTLLGGRVKTYLRIVATVCVFGRGSRRTFFLYMDPLAHGGGLGSELQVPPVPPPPPIWPLASEEIAIFTLDRLFGGTCKFFGITSQRCSDRS